MAKRSTSTASRKKLSVNKTYTPADLVVTSDVERPDSDADSGLDRLPAREVIYRTVRERGTITVEELAMEFGGMAPGGARPPYADDAATYVLRMVSGGLRELPGLASFDELVGILARDPGPDPDYGFEVRPA